mmetsp:Transcript_31264/g.89668  ORF Transcript_31264/g.89668 Transcript_31264/m.89668 type:complete len:391 (-) Transcript_31264:27-1199(-)
MVATLSRPVELIRVQRCGSAAFKCAVAEMQGWRASHEDAHAVRCGAQAACFWVLDGHRGDEAARFGSDTLVHELDQAAKGCGLPTDKRIEQTFETVDRKLRGHLQHHGGCPHAGSTVVGALIAQQGDGCYSAKLVNCGDSRGILIHGPQERKATAVEASVRLPRQLENFEKKACWTEDASWLPSWPAIVETIDHKPTHPTERARIEAAGGQVCGGRRARVDGNLAVSRGLGDFDFKDNRSRPASEQKVSCAPDIYEVADLQEGALLLLACDGLWDVMTSEEAASFVRGRLKRDPNADLGAIAAALIRFCLRMESSDNMTVLLAHFVDGAEWANARDEIIGFEKLTRHGPIDKDTRKQYQSFLRKLDFAPCPVPQLECSEDEKPPHEVARF